jgi:hypothetical protein
MLFASLTGLLRFRAIGYPVRIFVFIVWYTIVNEVLVHFVLENRTTLFNAYFIYASVTFLCYQLFFVSLSKARSELLISVLTGVIFFALGFGYDFPKMNNSFPTGSIVFNSIGILIHSLVFVKRKLNRPDETKIQHDSVFMLVLGCIVYWSSFISKHALQTASIEADLMLVIPENLFSAMNVLYYGLIGLVFFRHGKYQSGESL